MKKYYHGCHTHIDKHQRVLYFEGFTEGMKPAGVFKLYQRSAQNCGVSYKTILTMGILKGFLMATQAKPYSDSVPMRNFNG
jgi:hypothetical protein